MWLRSGVAVAVAVAYVGQQLQLRFNYGFLAWELPCATGAALKKIKEKKKKKISGKGHGQGLGKVSQISQSSSEVGGGPWRRGPWGGVGVTCGVLHGPSFPLSQLRSCRRLGLPREPESLPDAAAGSYSPAWHTEPTAGRLSL